MLVIIGANGRIGVELVKQAMAAGREVRPVCRDDRDTGVLDDIVDVQQVCYADPDHPASLAPVLVGARQVIIAIDARVAGPGAPLYGDHAGVHCIQAATDAGAQVALYLSVAGGYRWSPSKLNRRAFHLDRWVRRAQGCWSMMRFACFHDEVIEGHVRPPDGGRPRPVPRSSQYTPLSRVDAARVVMHNLPTLVAGRTIYVGGPQILTSDELAQAIAPHVVPGRGPKTHFFPLPPGDLSVLPDATHAAAGTLPQQTLDQALRRLGTGSDNTAVQNAAGDVSTKASLPMPERPAPGPHPADLGKNYKVSQDWGPNLRRVVHAQLMADLADLGLSPEDGTVSFRHARSHTQRQALAHDGTLRPMIGVRVHDASGALVHKGPVDFLHDPLARELRIWWRRADGSIPATIWRELDVGVKRRAAADPCFVQDARVQSFRSGHELDRSAASQMP
ncbi:MAG: NAD(P)H-binding protein [Oligoflexia bacterium]|nr:NAD(P)H-binding protein [Oligoflexia bacterium]